jgi:drug/metabolite transporter (DMT)-like permease
MSVRPSPATASADRGLGTVAPVLFVVLWASGYVVARLAMPHAPPLGFLAVRYAATLVVLAPLILLARAPWPDPRTAVHLALAGLLLHAAYLAGVWAAIAGGMSAGVAALIVNLQPVLTAAWLAARGEPIGARCWLGLALGFGGVALVVAHRVGTEGLSVASVALALGALIAITAGTLHQRRHAPSFDLRTGAFVQYAASLAATAPLALALESGARWDWGAPLVLALGWSVLALSIGAVFLMMVLIRRGSATRVASLFYLVPPVTALQAWLLFDEPFGPRAAAGMALVAIGVALVVRR